MSKKKLTAFENIRLVGVHKEPAKLDGPNHIEDADVVIDFHGGKDAAAMYRKRIKQLKGELDKYKDALAIKFNAEMCEALKPIRDKLTTAQAENKRLRAQCEIARCPCGGWFESLGVMRSTQVYTYQCEKCGVRLEIARKALKGKVRP